MWLTGIVIAGGAFGPDSLGKDHGYFLQPRLILLGLVSFTVIFDLDLKRWTGRTAALALGVSVLLQSIWVWDYATVSTRTVGPLMATKDRVGRQKRVVISLAPTPRRFRINPALHADCLLGLGTENIIWNNYETVYYYFPVQFVANLSRPQPPDLQFFFEQPDDLTANDRLARWRRTLSLHANAIDVVLVCQANPELDAVTAQYFDCTEEQEGVRIYRRKNTPMAESGAFRSSVADLMDGFHP